MNNERIENILQNLGSENVPADVHRIVEETSEQFTKTLTSLRKPILWSDIMKSPITKLATAAVIIIAVMIGINQFGGSIDGASVVWADVVKNVEQIQTYVFRLKTKATGFDSKGAYPEAEMIVYNSSRYGTRMDTYIDDKVMSITYSPAAKNVVITVVPEAKKYMRISLTEEQLNRMQGKDKDPKEFIRLFTSVEYTELGRDVINGVKVEGIEVDSPKIGGGMFESAMGRLWVDVETDWPVRMEIEGVADGGKVRTEMVMDKFEWDVELDPGIFEPNIPADYSLMADMQLPDTDESVMIDGLRFFAELSDGKYPSSMASMTVAKQMQQVWQQKYDRPPTDQERENFLKVNMACAFYAQLDQEGKEPQYYGDTVTADDSDKVLMKWRISDNEYRVIYGDLTTENIADKEKLLDKAIKLSGAKIPADKRGLVMRMLSLNERDLIKGMAVFLDLSGGRYPSKLNAKTTIKQADALGAKWSGIPEDEQKKKAQDIFFASAFYDKLVREKKDVAYYGDKITVEDSGKVLMRWKISDNEYRVIFADLTAENVSAEELAELEKGLAK
ncbi:MAG TPA: hypothetical protein ENH34_07100 [Phycisphaerales bacterium]|nr:hypothetical protein [Phycisphaerales bacterium]